MRGNRLAELGLDIQQPRPTVEVALLRFLEINKGCIDITPMNTLLFFSVDIFVGKNEIIGSFTIRKICTIEYASAATRTTDMDWVKTAPLHHPMLHARVSVPIGSITHPHATYSINTGSPHH